MLMHYQSNTSIYFKVDRLINTSVIPITAKFKMEIVKHCTYSIVIILIILKVYILGHGCLRLWVLKLTQF